MLKKIAGFLKNAAILVIANMAIALLFYAVSAKDASYWALFRITMFFWGYWILLCLFIMFFIERYEEYSWWLSGCIYFGGPILSNWIPSTTHAYIISIVIMVLVAEIAYKSSDKYAKKQKEEAQKRYEEGQRSMIESQKMLEDIKEFEREHNIIPK